MKLLNKREVLDLIQLETQQYFAIPLLVTLSYSMYVPSSLFSLISVNHGCQNLSWDIFFLMQLPAGADHADLEERILQHLAAAAAMGQARHSARREGHRNRSGIHGRPQFLVFSSHPNSSSTSPPPGDNREGEASPRIMVATISPPPSAGEESPQLNASVSPTDQSSTSAPQSSSASASQLGSPSSDRYSSLTGFIEFVPF